MKKMKKIFALLIAMVMVLGMSTMAFAEDGDEGGTTTASDKVTITVNRDSTYAGDASEAGRAYTWYKVFSATYDSSVSSNASGYGTDGTANVNAGGTTGIAYYATAAVGTILKGEGNLWFDVKEIAGSTDYVVSWKDSVTKDATTLQAAAKWLVDNNAYEATGSMTFNGSSAWTANVDKGYYVIKGDVGDNLIAATTDITVNEKNDYPPLDKTQADEDNTAQADAAKNVAVGDVIPYEVKVTIPKTAAVGNTIVVWDKPSTGLTYNNDVAVKSNEGNATVTAGTAGTGEAWRYTITVTEGSQGKDVVFSCTMTVNANALTDTDKENESGLSYGNNYDSLPDTVNFKTYFAGIVKTAETANGQKLEGVKFTLKEGTTEFKVTKNSDGYYIPDVNGSSEVVTDANGLIIIRGLDSDKTYTLTETETLAGYNLLENPVTLSLQEDTATAVEATTDEETGETTEASTTYSISSFTNWGSVINNKGTTLPSTGGIGTTIFYIVGAILVIGAGVVLVTRRRMNAQ